MAALEMPAAAEDRPPVPDLTSAPVATSSRLPSSWGTLHAFALPEELVSSLQDRRSVPSPTGEASSGLSEPVTAPKSSAVGGLTCQVCDAQFDSSEAQRAHFRTDWHRFNVSRRLKGGSGSGGVGEDEFAALVEKLKVEDEGQQSGSSSSESESSTTEDEAQDGESGLVARLLRRYRRHDSSALGALSEEDDDGTSPRADGSPLAWMTAQPILPRTVQFGVYKCALPISGRRKRGNGANVDSEAAELRTVQYGPEPPGKAKAGEDDVEELPPHWTVIMLGGGHFAAAVISLRPKLRHVGKNRPAEKELIVLAHKTFHRYTTRRKQGGGQSAHDAGGKGAAKSAGANLRRYNEQALAEDIRNLLTSWASMLDTSSLIFLRASRAYSKLFFHPSTEGAAIFDRHDPRLRTFPFPTRRATLDETLRCAKEVITVKVLTMTEDELAELEAPPKPTETPLKRVPKVVEERVSAPAKPKLSQDEERRLQRWRRVIDMVQKGRVDALDSFLNRRRDEAGPDADVWLKSRIPDAVGGVPGANVDWTLLHVAAAADQAAATELLLNQWRCNPTALSSANEALSGKTPYELAPSKATRNVFRRAMAAEPSRCDWLGAARVPSALTEEMEQAQSGRGKDRKARLKEKLKERDREREEARVKAESEEAAAATRQKQAAAAAFNGSAKGPQKLGGGAAGIIGQRQRAEVSGLTEEQRARLERERRARAAEARMAGGKKA